MAEKEWQLALSGLAGKLDADSIFLYRHIPGEKILRLYRHQSKEKEIPSSLSLKDGVVREILESAKPLSGESKRFGEAFSKFQPRYLIACSLKHEKKVLGFLLAGKKKKATQSNLDLFSDKAFQFSCLLAIEEFKNEKDCLTSKITALEQNLNSAYQRILESDKLASLGRFAGGLAHELNTPLGAIQTYAEYVQLFVKGETEQESLDGILKAVAHCKDIIENVLRLSREGKHNLEPVSLHEVIQDALVLAGPEMEKRRIQLVSNIQSDVPPVLGDRTRLVQVLTNLLANAGDALLRQRLIPREGLIKISLLHGNGSDVIEISDNGPGIPRRIMGRIFDPFFTTKEIGQGTGLGLSICNAIVEEHHGKLEVSSEEGKGTSVLVKIPALRDRKEDEPHVQASDC